MWPVSGAAHRPSCQAISPLGLSSGTFPAKNNTEDRPHCLSSMHPQSGAQRYTGLSDQTITNSSQNDEINALSSQKQPIPKYAASASLPGGVHDSEGRGTRLRRHFVRMNLTPSGDQLPRHVAHFRANVRRKSHSGGTLRPHVDHAGERSAAQCTNGSGVAIAPLTHEPRAAGTIPYKTLRSAVDPAAGWLHSGTRSITRRRPPGSAPGGRFRGPSRVDRYAPTTKRRR